MIGAHNKPRTGKYERKLTPPLERALRNIAEGRNGDDGLTSQKEKGGYVKTYYALRRRGLIVSTGAGLTSATDKGKLALAGVIEWREPHERPL